MDKIIAVIIALGTIIGGTLAYDSTLVKSEELEKVKNTIRFTIASDEVRQIQDRIWIVEDRHQNVEMPDTVIETIRDLKARLADIERHRDKLQRKPMIDD